MEKASCFSIKHILLNLKGMVITFILRYAHEALLRIKLTVFRDLPCKKSRSSPIDVTEVKDPLPCPCLFVPFGSGTKTSS